MRVFLQSVNPNWPHETVTWLGPEYVFPVISYRPHAMPYLRTEEREEKKMNEREMNGQSDKRGPALRRQEEKH